MAISIVAAIQGSFLNNGADDTISLAAGPPVTGDVVIVAGGHGASTAALAAPAGDNSGAYTEIYSRTSGAPICGCWYQIMGSTPDSEVVCDGGGNADDAVGYVVYILRGVDTDNVLDAAAETFFNAGINPDPPSITTVTDGALVLALANGDVNETGFDYPVGYTNQVARNGNDLQDFTVALGSKTVLNAGAENPSSYLLFSSSNALGATVAIRPLLSDKVRNYIAITRRRADQMNVKKRMQSVRETLRGKFD